jgi:5-methylcytosine-specific restriction endonuclease McrA
MFGCFGKSNSIKKNEETNSESKETIDANNSIKNTKPMKTIKPKKKISATLKRLVWNTNIGEEIGKTKCLCCKSTDITQMSFHCGHVVAEANGGELIVSNLKPICQNCNSSMGTKNMNDFMNTFK